MFSFIETRLFTKLVVDYLSDEEYAALQVALMTDPEAGLVIPGSGGVRKLRWAAPGARQAGRLPRDLLRPPRTWRDLDSHDVSEERLRQHPSSCTPEDPEGSGRWLRQREMWAVRSWWGCARLSAASTVA